MGAAVGDYDNDGLPDLYVTNYGGNILYRNKGDGTFDDVTARARVAAGGWTSSAGFFDYDNDGRLDLFVTRYLEWGFEQPTLRGEQAGLPLLLPPRPVRAARTSCIATTATARSPTSGKAGIARRRERASVSRSATTTAMASSTSMSPTIPCSASCSTTIGTARSRGRPNRRCRVQRGRQDLRRHGRGLRRLRQRRQADIFVTDLPTALPSVPQNAEGGFRDAST